MNTLEEFCDFWLKNRPINMNHDAYYSTEEAVGGVIFRQAPFQVQLFMCAPNTDVPDHIHPNVDSFEVYVGGDIWFRIDGSYVYEDESKVGQLIHRVRPNCWHGAKIGNRGGVFFSIQHWLNNKKITSVNEDWDGVPVGNRHKADIERYKKYE